MPRESRPSSSCSELSDFAIKYQQSSINFLSRYNAPPLPAQPSRYVLQVVSGDDLASCAGAVPVVASIGTQPIVRMVLGAQRNPNSPCLRRRGDLLPICGARTDARGAVAVLTAERAQADVVSRPFALHTDLVVARGRGGGAGGVGAVTLATMCEKDVLRDGTYVDGGDGFGLTWLQSKLQRPR